MPTTPSKKAKATDPACRLANRNRDLPLTRPRRVLADHSVDSAPRAGPGRAAQASHWKDGCSQKVIYASNSHTQERAEPEAAQENWTSSCASAMLESIDSWSPDSKKLSTPVQCDRITSIQGPPICKMGVHVWPTIPTNCTPDLKQHIGSGFGTNPCYGGSKDPQDLWVKAFSFFLASSGESPPISSHRIGRWDWHLLVRRSLSCTWAAKETWASFGEKPLRLESCECRRMISGLANSKTMQSTTQLVVWPFCWAKPRGVVNISAFYQLLPKQAGPSKGFGPGCNSTGRGWHSSVQLLIGCHTSMISIPWRRDAPTAPCNNSVFNSQSGYYVFTPPIAQIPTNLQGRRVLWQFVRRNRHQHHTLVLDGTSCQVSTSLVPAGLSPFSLERFPVSPAKLPVPRRLSAPFSWRPSTETSERSSGWTESSDVTGAGWFGRVWIGLEMSPDPPRSEKGEVPTGTAFASFTCLLEDDY